jgi:hypothetical protein
MRCADGAHDHHFGLSITRSVTLGLVTSPSGSGRSLPSWSGRSLASGDRHDFEAHRSKVRTNDLIYDTVGRVLEPARLRFNCPVPEVARLLRVLTFAGSHPLITDGHPLMPEPIVSVLLDGVRVRSADPAETTPGDEPC